MNAIPANLRFCHSYVNSYLIINHQWRLEIYDKTKNTRMCSPVCICPNYIRVPKNLKRILKNISIFFQQIRSLNTCPLTKLKRIKQIVIGKKKNTKKLMIMIIAKKDLPYYINQCKPLLHNGSHQKKGDPDNTNKLLLTILWQFNLISPM